MDELERIERIDRAVPYDLNAERSTLGSILLDRDAIIAVAGWLHPEYFYLQKHAYIYEAMLACYNRRIPPDLTTVIDELRRQNRLEQVGGIFALSELAGYVPTAVHVEYYARIVERTAIFRRLIEAGGKITALGYAEHEEVEDALDKAEAELFAVSQRRTMQDFVHIGSVIDTYFEQVSDLSERRSELVGLPTGYYDLDKLTGGLQRSDLLILAARPSVGKTSLALSLAYHAGVVQQHTVAIFSLEMSREQLVQRLLAMHTGIDTQRLRTGNIDRDLQRVMEGMGVLSSAPIFIDDTPALSIMEMRSRARRLHAQSRIELIVVDYLQLMQGRRSDNRVQEVSEISRGLKALARELNVPVLALSQLSRSVEGRTNHVPMLSDLRESGCLAGDTLVYLPETGDYCRIDALVGQHGFNVLALDPTTYQLVACPVERAFTTGEQLVYTLTTRLGRTIRATANHKFLTVNGWVRLDALTLGQRIALPRHTIQYTTNDGALAQNISRERAAAVARVVSSPHLAQLAQSDVYWDEIVSITPNGVEPVYDLTVARLHNFVANDIIVHNSIEQDADIVMFIYREDMYDRETDKKGIAEIHIAKHRNGPLGVVPLRFEATTTSFQNLEHHRYDTRG